MRYLTDRKRAVGKGASHHGTSHHIYMQMSAVGLACMLPVWIYIFGSALGQSHEVVLATFARPFPAILTGLLLVVGMRHFQLGATMMIEDYAHGSARKIFVLIATSISYLVIATGLYALVRIAL
jgi:succinate dehydrogenase / fumarate reductase membrane anchor subunit